MLYMSRQFFQALRLAWILPLRISIVGLCSISAICIALWDQVETQRVLTAQGSASNFLGEKGWRASLKIRENGPLAPPVGLANSSSFDFIDDELPLVFVLRTPIALRSGGSIRTELVRIGFATRGSGLANVLDGGAIPCVWMGSAQRQDMEWMVGSRLRCTRISAPDGWAALSAEADSDLLILPVGSSNLAVGSDWRLNVDTIIGSKGISCASLMELDGNLECSEMASSMSSRTVVASRLSGWSKWVVPSVFLGLGLSILYYLFGLLPLITQIFALRLALGQTIWVALFDALSMVAIQLAVIEFVLVTPLFLASIVLKLNHFDGVLPILIQGLGWLFAISVGVCAALLVSKRRRAASMLVNWR